MKVTPASRFFIIIIINMVVFFSFLVLLISVFEGYYRYNDYPGYNTSVKYQRTVGTPGYFQSNYPNIKNSVYNLIPGEFSQIRPEFTAKFSVNSNGYRDDNFDTSKKINTVIYGDSFTFGHGMSTGERFSDLLAKDQPNLNIANFAYNAGFTSPHYLLHFNLNKQLSPEKVFVFSYLGNDCQSDIDESRIISDNEGGYPLRIVDNGNIYGDRAQYPQYVIFLSENSVFLYNVFKSIYNSKYANLIFNKRALPNQFNKIDFDMGEDPNSCQKYLTFVKNIEKQCMLRNNNCEVYNFLIPQGFFIYNDEHTYHSQLDKVQLSNAFQDKKLLTRVIENCDKLKVNCIDLTDIFLNDNNRYYFKSDGHWNKQGHIKVSRFLNKFFD